jgi:hypothetical protein
MCFEEAAMGHCYHHALSSVKKWGGTAEEFLPLHQWFDESKSITADFRHRALRHHAEGVFMLERFFGARAASYPCGLSASSMSAKTSASFRASPTGCGASGRRSGWAAPSRSTVTSIRSPGLADLCFSISDSGRPKRPGAHLNCNAPKFIGMRMYPTGSVAPAPGAATA